LIKGFNMTHIKKLLRLSKALGIKVAFIHYPGNGAWHPAVNKISVDRDLEGTELVSTILHELGHVVDDLANRSDREWRKLDKAYSKVYKNKASTKQLRLVLKHERRAWTFGREIARLLKIKLGKWYDRDEKDSIADYKS